MSSTGDQPPPLGSQGNESLGRQRPDPLSHLLAVKHTFRDQQHKYDMYLEAMLDFKAQRIDTNTLTARLKELFKGHNNLIVEFNCFLPSGYEIPLDDNDASESQNKSPLSSFRNESNGEVTMITAHSYVEEVKDTFHDQQRKYNRFLNVMSDFRDKRINFSTLTARLKELFKGHNNLIIGFNKFLHPRYNKIALDDDVEDEVISSTFGDH